MSPGGPAGPGGPWTPCGPGRPCGPGVPGSPFNPGGPGGPVPLLTLNESECNVSLKRRHLLCKSHGCSKLLTVNGYNFH